MNLCLDCAYRKKELPCYHPVVAEVMPNTYDGMTASGYVLAVSYGKIREKFDLKFEPSSWDVCRCKGHTEDRISPD